MEIFQQLLIISTPFGPKSKCIFHRQVKLDHFINSYKVQTLAKKVKDRRRFFSIVNCHQSFLPKAAHHQPRLKTFLSGPKTK